MAIQYIPFGIRLKSTRRVAMDHTLQALQAYIEWPSSIFLSKGVLKAPGERPLIISLTKENAH